MRTCVVASNNQGENTTKTKKGKTGAKAPIFPFLVEVTRFRTRFARIKSACRIDSEAQNKQMPHEGGIFEALNQ
jgi:hypothetical protein